MSCGECNVISFYFMCFSVNGYACLVGCVFVNYFVKQFVICMCGCYFVDECYVSV